VQPHNSHQVKTAAALQRLGDEDDTWRDERAADALPASKLTPNLAAILRTPGLPGVARVSRIRFSSVRAIGDRPSQNNARASRVGAARSRLAAMSILPEPSEPVRRHRCVAHGRGNRAVTEIVLNCPRVVPVIGELVAAGMP